MIKWSLEFELSSNFFILRQSSEQTFLFISMYDVTLQSMFLEQYNEEFYLFQIKSGPWSTGGSIHAVVKSKILPLVIDKIFSNIKLLGTNDAYVSSVPKQECHLKNSIKETVKLWCWWSADVSLMITTESFNTIKHQTRSASLERQSESFNKSNPLRNHD